MRRAPARRRLPLAPRRVRSHLIAAVLVTRPQCAAARTAARLNALGHRALVSPLLVVEPLAWNAPPGTEGVVVASARALVPGDRALAPLLALPCYAVGPATAAAARVAGFTEVRQPTSGGLDALWAALEADATAPVHLLHLSARERTDAPPPPRFRVAVRETYSAAPSALTPEAVAAWAAGALDLALLYSARTAEQLALEADRLTLPRATVAVAALSSTVLTAAGLGWRGAAAAATPDETALFLAAGLVPAGCGPESHVLSAAGRGPAGEPA